MLNFCPHLSLAWVFEARNLTRSKQYYYLFKIHPRSSNFLKVSSVSLITGLVWPLMFPFWNYSSSDGRKDLGKSWVLGLGAGTRQYYKYLSGTCTNGELLFLLVVKLVFCLLPLLIYLSAAFPVRVEGEFRRTSLVFVTFPCILFPGKIIFRFSWHDKLLNVAIYKKNAVVVCLLLI